jgi:hypothetical protein
MAALEPLTSLGIVKDRDEFSKRLKSAFKKAGIKVPVALFKAILMVWLSGTKRPKSVPNFYKYTSPRPLDEIETDLKKIETEILEMLNAE